MSRFGATTRIDTSTDNTISLTLAPATANTIEGYPDAYFIGGEPQIVVEPLPNDDAPLEPTYENLPAPGTS